LRRAGQITHRLGFFAQAKRPTASAGTDENAAGALHMAFVHNDSKAEGAAAAYATCAAGARVCTGIDAWRLGDFG
jgi:hypothetical protein